jgi:hypothetical protein
LVGHFIITALIAIVMIYAIDNHSFNISSPKPAIEQFDGSFTHPRYRPRQSDITTVISFALTVMRLVSGMWTAAMAWRCSFILMEKTGVSLQNINWMLTYSLPAEIRARRGITVVVVAIILLLAFPSQLAAPILTGSITWEPTENLVPGDQLATGISQSSDGGTWSNYRTYPEDVTAVSAKALGIADTAWDSKIGTTMKRVLRSTANLPINSTLTNVTVPYFSIDAFEWIHDPSSTITQQQIALLSPGLPGGNNPYFTATLVVALIPDTDGWNPPTTTTFPSPTTISQTGTLYALYNHVQPPTACDPSQDGYFGGLPSGVGFYANIVSGAYTNSGTTNCFVFAQVTYTAGVAVCESCLFSASTVVQPTTALQVVADPMTSEAMVLMPLLGTNMGLGGSSVPPATNIEQYIRDILPRSYGAAWTALSDYLSGTKLTTDVMIPIPVSTARVLHWRIYLWVVLNIMLTLSGLLFLIVQYQCDNMLVVDTGIVALLMDTQRVQEQDSRGLSDLSKLTEEDSQIGLLQLRKQDGHKYVDLSQQI